MTPLGTVVAGRPDAGHPSGLLDVRVRILKLLTALRIAANPDLRFGEASMDGDLVAEQGTFCDVREPVASNIAVPGPDPDPEVGQRLSRLAGAISARDDPGKAKANVAHHDDPSGELYRSFLDADLAPRRLRSRPIDAAARRAFASGAAPAMAGATVAILRRAVSAVAGGRKAAINLPLTMLMPH